MTEVTKLLLDGVYLHLDENEYFAQDRQGSTDEAKLFLQQEGWWWASSMNPDYEPEKEDQDRPDLRQGAARAGAGGRPGLRRALRHHPHAGRGPRRSIRRTPRGK